MSRFVIKRVSLSEISKSASRTDQIRRKTGQSKNRKKKIAQKYWTQYETGKKMMYKELFVGAPKVYAILGAEKCCQALLCGFFLD